MTEYPSSSQNIQILQIYNIYRIVLAVVLSLSFYFSPSSAQLGSYEPELFIQVITLYGIFGAAVLIGLKPSKTFTSRQRLLSTLLVADILAISLVTYSSGGGISGFSLLHLVTISAGGILIKGKMSTLLAAIATITSLFIEAYLSISYVGAARQYVQSGLLGALLFATSIYLQILSQRIRKSTVLTEEQASSIYNLEQLNQMIIQRMRTGIMVVRPSGELITYNDAASRMFELPPVGKRLEINKQIALTPELESHLQSWTSNSRTSLPPIFLRHSAINIQVSFAFLNVSSGSDILVFLEDTSQFVQRAQQMKLASLGRLTASIAHEIRNPLGAISHASQLLQETNSLNDGDLRLLDIILNHCNRVNMIIEDVLHMSRHQQQNAERIDLKQWLTQFIKIHNETHTDDRNINIEIDIPQGVLEVKFIPSQLEQIINNLVENGLRYSEKATGKAHIRIQGRLRSENRPCLCIIDDGIGISADVEVHLFEPFYTTEKGGTGLGLYISKELCEANQAQLSYVRTPEGKSSFCVHFSHPDKNII
jgi:two-component system sensor histidine kinase PilS (NtrC family)